MFHLREKKFKIFHHQSNDPFSVNNESCHSFSEGKTGMIWFGTYGGGIGVFDPRTERFRSFTTTDGLAQELIRSIVIDKSGTYWVTSYGALSSFIPPDDPFAPGCKISFRNYDTKDGLLSVDFYAQSSFCDEDGTLYFGTPDGLIYFHPEDLKENDIIPPVFITDFSVNNKLITIKDSTLLSQLAEYTKEVKLNYRQNIISF